MSPQAQARADAALARRGPPDQADAADLRAELAALLAG